MFSSLAPRRAPHTQSAAWIVAPRAGNANGVLVKARNAPAAPLSDRPFRLFGNC